MILIIYMALLNISKVFRTLELNKNCWRNWLLCCYYFLKSCTFQLQKERIKSTTTYAAKMTTNKEGKPNPEISPEVMELTPVTIMVNGSHLENENLSQDNFREEADIDAKDFEARKMDISDNFAVIELDDNENENEARSNGVLNDSDNRAAVVDVSDGESDKDWFKPQPGYLFSDKIIEDEISHEKAGSIYAAKKTTAQGMLDIALLTANTSQLRVVLHSDEKTSLHTAIVVLISFSIALQILVGLCLLYIGTLDKEDNLKKRRANKLNNLVTMFIFVITILNVMVSSFGLENIQHLRAAPIVIAPNDHSSPVP